MSTKLDYLGLVPIERQLRCLGEFYNVPVTAEGEDLAANLKKLRVRRIKQLNWFSKVPHPPPPTTQTTTINQPIATSSGAYYLNNTACAGM